MDDLYLCRDCSAEHREPLEATLGHSARCLDCMLALELELLRLGASDTVAISIAA